MPRVYEVGGCVRDKIMQRPVEDVDRVVVGATEEFFSRKLFKKVGAHFPVFIHAETGEEWAMARREKKTGEGYVGFTFDFGSDVTLEENLARRDFTINAIAFDSENGVFVDPYGGKDDIEKKIIRAVNSDAFSDDPVRVLRMARFRARFGSDWNVDIETRKMVKNSVKKGLFAKLKPDRIWKEFSRAMMEDSPWLFFETLDECDSLKAIFPEIYRMKMTPESRVHHEEGNTWEHTKLVIQEVMKGEDDSLENRIAALFHDIGKIETPFDILPAHHGHDDVGADMMQSTLKKWGVPSRQIEICEWVARHHMTMHRLDDVRPRTILKLIAPKTKNHLNNHLATVSKADGLGRKNSSGVHDVSACDTFLEAAAKVNEMKVCDLPQDQEVIDDLKLLGHHEKIGVLLMNAKCVVIKEIWRKRKELKNVQGNNH